MAARFFSSSNAFYPRFMRPGFFPVVVDQGDRIGSARIEIIVKIMFND